MKNLLYYFLFCVFINVYSQNKQVLYNFADQPQALLLNPALETNYKFHLGVPLLSGNSFDIGSSEAVLTDVFSADGRDINDKIATLLNTLSIRDFVSVNTQIEILNAGFRINDKHYVSFGFYQELDAIGYFPKDIFQLFTEGNATNLNRNFSISQLRYKFDVIGVLHAGISKKISKNLTFGGRFKIFSSALNLESNNNTGTFTTTNGINSVYRNIFNNVNLNLRSAGLIENDEVIDEPESILKNTYFGADANLGMGLDFGIIYKFDTQFEFSASILDFGFINYKKNVKNTRTEGSFIFEGVEFEYDPNSSVNYWAQIDARFKEELPVTDDEATYVSWRPTKLNAALKYSFGEQRRLLCYDEVYKDYYSNALGVQLFSVFRPLSPQLALTAFYERTISKNFRSKVTYTIDDFSYANIGFGFSTQISKVNFYAMVDNLLEYRNLSSANRLTFQFGFNLIFK